jgi:hypothetical protein
MRLSIRPRKKVEAFRAKEWSPSAGKGHVKVVDHVKPGHAGTLYDQEKDKD